MQTPPDHEQPSVGSVDLPTSPGAELGLRRRL